MRKGIYGIFILLGFILIGIVGILFLPNTTNSSPAFIKIPSSTTEISDVLTSDIIQNKTTFKLASVVLQYNKVKSGAYKVTPNMSNFSIVRMLRSGKQTPIKFVLNNIQLKEDLASKIAQNLELDSASVILSLQNPTFCDSFNLNTENILTLIIPNTYEMYWNISEKKFFEKMQKEHLRFWNDARIKQATELGLSPNEVYILASIVQKEYAQKSERSRIAGVYLNRLKIHMPLQADATCKYATRDFAAKRVTDKHISFLSPYNTYKNLGLPPGPICVPEISTIDAVLRAEKNDYLYYCARPDLSGFHDFSNSYSVHQQRAATYRNMLNAQNIH